MGFDLADLSLVQVQRGAEVLCAAREVGEKVDGLHGVICGVQGGWRGRRWLGRGGREVDAVSVVELRGQTQVVDGADGQFEVVDVLDDDAHLLACGGGIVFIAELRCGHELLNVGDVWGDAVDGGGGLWEGLTDQVAVGDVFLDLGVDELDGGGEPLLGLKPARRYSGFLRVSQLQTLVTGVEDSARCRRNEH